MRKLPVIILVTCLTSPALSGDLIVDSATVGGGRIKIFYESATIPSQAVIEARAGVDHAHSSAQLYGVWAQDGTVFVRQTDNIDWLFEPNADVDGNGVVDEKDLHAIVNQWHQVDPTMTPTPWPVPTHTPVP